LSPRIDNSLEQRHNSDRRQGIQYKWLEGFIWLSEDGSTSWSANKPMISKLGLSFVPVTGSLALPALRPQYLPVSARSSAQKWSILPRRSAGSYAVGCVTTCLNRAAFLDTMCWHHRETANELQATETSPPNRRSSATPRTDEGVTKHHGGSAGKLAVRTCAIGLGALAVWLISESMGSRTGDTPPRQDLYGSILSVSANAAPAKPAPAAPSPSALISPTPAGIKISAPLKSKKLHATLPTTSRRTGGGWSEVGIFLLVSPPSRMLRNTIRGHCWPPRRECRRRTLCPLPPTAWNG
jgi:hypothetical protein